MNSEMLLMSTFTSDAPNFTVYTFVLLQMSCDFSIHFKHSDIHCVLASYVILLSKSFILARNVVYDMIFKRGGGALLSLLGRACCRFGPSSNPACGPLLHVIPTLSPISCLSYADYN